MPAQEFEISSKWKGPRKNSYVCFIRQVTKFTLSYCLIAIKEIVYNKRPGAESLLGV